MATQQTVPHSLCVVPFPAVEPITQLELTVFLSLRGRFHHLEEQVKQAEQSIKTRPEHGAALEPGAGAGVAWKAVLTSSPRLKPGDSYGSKHDLPAASAGSCFTERPYCTVSPQASHRARPSLGLATDKILAQLADPMLQSRGLRACARRLVIRLAERLRMNGETYCAKVLNSTKPTCTIWVVIE